MLQIYFDYIFVHLRQKVRLRPELGPKFLSTLGPNPARTRPDLQLCVAQIAYLFFLYCQKIYKVWNLIGPWCKVRWSNSRVKQGWETSVFTLLYFCFNLCLGCFWWRRSIPGSIGIFDVGRKLFCWVRNCGWELSISDWNPPYSFQRRQFDRSYLPCRLRSYFKCFLNTYFMEILQEPKVWKMQKYWIF